MRSRLAVSFFCVACLSLAACASSTTAGVLIGPSGGTVELAGVSLQVPAGALVDEQTITITRTEDAAPAAYHAYSALYRFGPEGLHFTRPATVTIRYDGDATRARLVWTAASGTGWELVPGTVTPHAISAQVSHFSEGFVGSPEDDAGVMMMEDAGMVTMEDAGMVSISDEGLTLPDTGVAPDAGVDEDAGTMMAVDLGLDAPVAMMTDSGVDLGADAATSIDLGVDAPVVMMDAGVDMDVDAGVDIDMDLDAGVDAGPFDSGPPDMGTDWGVSFATAGAPVVAAATGIPVGSRTVRDVATDSAGTVFQVGDYTDVGVAHGFVYTLDVTHMHGAASPLAWGALLGTMVWSAATDPAGDVIVAVSNDATTTFNDGSTSTEHMIVAKLAHDDGMPVWVRGYTGLSGEIRSVATDATGNVFFGGDFSGAVDFGGGIRTTTGGTSVPFVVSLGPTGAYRWDSIAAGHTAPDALRSVAVDPIGDVFLSCALAPADSVTFGATTHDALDASVILAKLSGSSGAVTWSRMLASTGLGSITGDLDGNLVLSAEGHGGDYADGPTAPGVLVLSADGATGATRWYHLYDGFAPGDVAIGPGGVLYVAVVAGAAGLDLGGGVLGAGGPYPFRPAVGRFDASTGAHLGSALWGPGSTGPMFLGSSPSGVAMLSSICGFIDMGFGYFTLHIVLATGEYDPYCDAYGARTFALVALLDH